MPKHRQTNSQAKSSTMRLRGLTGVIVGAIRCREEMGSKKMKELFIRNEWDVPIQTRLYTEFMASTKKNTDFGNFKDYYLFWRERVQGLPMSPEHFLEHFQNMLRCLLKHMPNWTQKRLTR